MSFTVVVILLIADAVVFYLIGSNNPTSKIKSQIIAKAKDAAGKL